jgi:hypothetical protein
MIAWRKFSVKQTTPQIQTGKFLTFPILYLVSVIIPLALALTSIYILLNGEKPFVRREGGFLSLDASGLRSLGHTVEGDWLLWGNKFSLLPGGRGRLILRLPRGDNVLTTFHLQTEKTKSTGAAFHVSLNGRRGRFVPLDGKIRVFYGGSDKGIDTLEMTAESGSAAAPVVILSRIERYVYTPVARLLIIFPTLIIIFLIPLMVYIHRRWKSMDGAVALSITALSTLLPWLRIYTSPWIWELFFVVGTILVVILISRKYFEKIPAGIFLLYVASFMVLGGCLRWSGLIESAGQLLDPDATGYLEIARRGGGLFETATTTAPYVREPFFIWILRMAFWIAPENDATLRLLTFLLSVAVIPATAYIARRWFGAPVALGAAFACAVNPYFIFMSARGLRMEIYLLLILAFLAALDGLRGKKIWGGLKVGLVTGILSLTQVTSLGFAIPLTLIFCIRRKVQPIVYITAIFLPLIMIEPHLAFNVRYADDPLYSSNIHASFYRNLEFAGRPGFPGVEEVRQNPYAGEPTSTFHYIFGLHTVPEVIRVALRGLWRIFFRGYVRGGLFAGSRVLFAGYLLGIFLALITSWRRWVFVALLLEAPTAFLAGIDLDWRLTMHVAPILYCLTILGLSFFLTFCKIYLSRTGDFSAKRRG